MLLAGAAGILGRMKLPQFTIRDLLLSTALIAAGIGDFLLLFRLPEALMNSLGILPAFLFLVSIYLSSGALIGAGLFLPFGKTWTGFAWGILAMLAFACLFPVFNDHRN